MKKYNSKIHVRRSIRLKEYDYSRPGSYFVTINVYDEKCMFGEILDYIMILNDYGAIANQQCKLLPTHFTNIEMDVFQIMPDHMHCIVNITGVVGVWAPLAGAHGAQKPETLGDIVGTYKSLVANACLELFKQKHPGKIMGKLWQRNFHDSIIRDEQAYQRIRAYIINNPRNWRK